LKKNIKCASKASVLLYQVGLFFFGHNGKATDIEISFHEKSGWCTIIIKMKIFCYLKIIAKKIPDQASLFSSSNP